MRQLLQRPQGWIGLGLAAVVLVAIGAAAIYVFGGGGEATAHAPLTAATFAPTSDGTVFTIDSSSEATFTIHEILLGQPNTVVGKTSQVAGQILINKQDPAKSQVGQIKVDLSTLMTDNDLRNRTLQNRIFETSDAANQFATFTPKSLTGLPSIIPVGQTVSFQITGGLTIHQVTRTVTFAVQVTAVSQTQLKGQAQATVQYKDFNLAIPNVPTVAGVLDDVQLALTFTANA